MARPLRIEFPGALYHLTARGNARQDIFHDDEDRDDFLRLLGREIQQQRWRCYAYCLMSNHYHLLIETPEGRLVSGMRRLNGAYTQRFNRRHDRVGHLFQGRYKSIVVDADNYLLELCRYIVLNPVRAGMVREVGEWPWSSYQGTIGQAPTPDWLAVDGVLGQFGGDEQTARIHYQRFVTAGIATESPWQALRGQMWLGSVAFREKMQGLIEDKPLTGIPRQQAQPTRPPTDEVINLVAQTYEIQNTKVLDRSCQVAFQAAVYLLRRVVNLSLHEVSILAGVSIPRISQIQHKIEAGLNDDRLDVLIKIYQVKN